MATFISKSGNNITIKLSEPLEYFLQSINLLLESLGPIINKTNDSLYFHGNSIQLLQDTTMTYDLTVKMVETISIQLLYLEKKGLCIIGFDLTDIRIINESIFILINPANILPYNQTTGKIDFNSPFDKPMYISTEIESIKSLPSEASYLVGRTALSKLCIGLLNLNVTMDTIMYTRLYWFLKRCLFEPTLFILI